MRRSSRTTERPDGLISITKLLSPFYDPLKFQFRPDQFSSPSPELRRCIFPATNPGITCQTILACTRQGRKGREKKGSARRQSQLHIHLIGTTAEGLPRLRPTWRTSVSQRLSPPEHSLLLLRFSRQSMQSDEGPGIMLELGVNVCTVLRYFSMRSSSSRLVRRIFCRNVLGERDISRGNSSRTRAMLGERKRGLRVASDGEPN
jgi:hypothetical protein